MEYKENQVICNCKQVTYVDIERVLHQKNQFADVEQEFADVQAQTACSTGCGGCHDKIMDVISQIISG